MAQTITRLHDAVIAERGRSPSASRTAKLLHEGLVKMAKKLAEEAIEVGIEAVRHERDKTVQESVDLIYNLVVLWTEMGILPDDVWAEMDRRERLYGIAGKLPKSTSRTEAHER